MTNDSRAAVLSRGRRGMAARASATGGKRISQNEFTEKAWQSIVAAPDIAQNASQQIVDTEHLLKALLEQPNGLARRIVSKAGSNPTLLLERTDQYIRQQPRVTGDSSQVHLSARLVQLPFVVIHIPAMWALFNLLCWPSAVLHQLYSVLCESGFPK